MNMRKIFFWGISLLLSNSLFAQRECGSFEYRNRLIQIDPTIQNSQTAVENFINLHISSNAKTQQLKRIIIPVIVHVLYHYPSENIPDNLVKSQITALNRDFRKQNADTIKIPAAFKSAAADCGIEFQLATVDTSGRATSGILHKYTPIVNWSMNDKIKFSSEMGDDAWDSKSYLNIWVGTLDKLVGYSSIPGGPPNKDGIVISNRAFGITNYGIYDQGRTAVHEVGHWLGLRHLWGDADCGDDGIADTPKQETFTNGCPSGIRPACDNSPNGVMYMDYMDFTNDDCLLMFTEGQKQRMRSLFEQDGPRYSILSSNGLSAPTIEQIPIPDTPPQWLHVKIYPDPAANELTVNVAFDERWIGKELQVINLSGQVEIRQTITSKIHKLNISKLKPGLYFIRAAKDGDKILEKFIKL
jgi:hypothetical protein